MTRDDFLKLSNSKYMGQATCDYINNTGQFTKLKLKGIKEVLTEDSLGGYHSLLKQHNIRLLEDVLPNIYRPPKYLYAMGSGKITSKRVGIIGARQCSIYGEKVAYQIAYKLASQGFTIVSGLAYGIDVKAHRGALAASGSTIAVLGSGILNCYPKSHYKDFLSIKEKGLIISEYGFYGKPHKHHFPFRNRLISGFSDVLIVVEAALSSGTMNTVKYALDQGKTIYAVPGSIFSEKSEGTNKLIEQGAYIVTSIEDLCKKLCE